MHTLIESLEPFHHLQGVAELGFWRRHQRDAQLRAMARLFLGCALRWSLIAVLLLASDEWLGVGLWADIVAVCAALAVSFMLIIATTAAAFVIGSRIRTA
jgi:hypothetical protein